MLSEDGRRRSAALVVGGASGLGAATATALYANGWDVVIADLDGQGAERLARSLGPRATAVGADVMVEEDVARAVSAAGVDRELRVAVVCAGVGHAERLVNRKSMPHSRGGFDRTIGVNLVGTFSVLSHVAGAFGQNEPDERGERGAIVLTSSIAAFDGQMGQVAYSASKAGIAGMVLPAARDLSELGIRVCGIAPGTFETPLLAGLPEAAREGLAAGIPFPKRLGDPAEFAALALHIIENQMLNGEVIRLDGAIRMPLR
jgi:NAD(P)-dependent dehydrogenase (short-subunit alcohol dehydrogenase family)